MTIFTLEPGRSIHKNGAPFVHITRNVAASAFSEPSDSASPVEADNVARGFVAMHDALVNMCELYADMKRPIPAISERERFEYFEKALEALKLARGGK